MKHSPNVPLKEFQVKAAVNDALGGCCYLDSELHVNQVLEYIAKHFPDLRVNVEYKAGTWSVWPKPSEEASL